MDSAITIACLASINQTEWSAIRGWKAESQQPLHPPTPVLKQLHLYNSKQRAWIDVLGPCLGN